LFSACGAIPSPVSLVSSKLVGILIFLFTSDGGIGATKDS